MKIEFKWTKRVIAWIKSWDPALLRSTAETQLEQAVFATAEKFNLQFVEQKPVVGVQADIVIKYCGLSLCGISGVSKTGLPPRTLARALETHIRQLTTTEWEFVLAGEQ